MTREKPLSELDPDFCTINGARALMFECPVCEGKDAHAIAVTFEPPSLYPSGALWRLVDGNRKTYTVAPSINCDHGQGCTFHGFVENGVVKW